MMDDFLVSAKDVIMLATELGLPNEVCRSLQHEPSQKLLQKYANEYHALTQRQNAENAWKSLEKEIKYLEDNGVALLAIYLAAACITRKNYARAGVSDNVFVETMKCFNRFLQEANLRGNKYIFDRGFWAWRHLCCKIFRLGTLEFEIYEITEKCSKAPNLPPKTCVLSVHIPSDAVLQTDVLNKAYTEAERFFKQEGAAFCDGNEPKAIICGTWLLSSQLNSLLKPTSGIKQFSADYELYDEKLENGSVYTWLFNGKTILDEMPQYTSLQKAVVKHLQNGGVIGDGFGIKKDCGCNN